MLFGWTKLIREILHQKPRKKELTDAQKAENKVISGIRMVVEHAIGGIKRFRCITDTFRSKFGKDDQMIVVAAAL
ncbi:MAG: transposase family protein, partial [Holosporaceae bacterium]|nr:transposase family protein [Holosporaceae bacterium]